MPPVARCVRYIVTLLWVQSADYFARAGDGILRDQDDMWWAISGGVLSRLE
jgi:hypothetical protein